MVLPPVGYEYWTSHRTLRILAERLAAAGLTVLRVDYDGTGDSAGDQWDDDRLAAWRASVRHAAHEMRSLGTTSLTIVGLRLGATLALDAAEVGANAIVAWIPVESGRRYVKELRLLGTPVPDDTGAPSGSIAIAGVAFPAPLLDDLRALDVGTLAAAPARAVLLVDRPDRPAADATAERLVSLGVDVHRQSHAGSEHMLDEPTEYATVPANVVDAIVSWVSDLAPDEGTFRSAPAPRRDTELPWRGAVVREEIVELGAHRLVGVRTRPPPNRAPTGTTVVFLNTGSEPHIGPGRAWVEYTRALASAGHTCLRLDFRGWGESPHLGDEPGRPYDAHTLDDTLALAEYLNAHSNERIVFAGLCAGAWIALRAVAQRPVAGVFALNPQLYWDFGDPVEATMAETRKRRSADRRRDELGARFGMWNVLDIIGVRHRAAGWLRSLAAGPTKVRFVFAQGDDGIEFLQTRVGRAFGEALRSPAFDVVEVPAIDHSMHRTWHRDAIVETLTEFLDSL